jgi:hypothetical protein
VNQNDEAVLTYAVTMVVQRRDCESSSTVRRSAVFSVAQATTAAT